MLTAANKRLLIFESRGDLNQCTPYRGNPTNTPYAYHAQSAYGPGPYVSHMINAYQPFLKSSTYLNRYTAPKKKGSRPNPQHAGWPVHGSVPSFPPKTAKEAVGKNQASVDDMLLYSLYRLRTEGLVTVRKYWTSVKILEHWILVYN
jgi:hypothetical protein